MSNLKEEEDYYINDNGFLVFTAAYHLKRGSCCGNGCLHCPYKEQPQPPLTPPREGNYRSGEDVDLGL
jgi:Family of unknown function (DUF5522)